MSHLLALLEYGVVVMMGPCCFIPMWLSIFFPDMGTSIPLFKIPIGKWFRSLCPSLVACLRWTMVAWQVGSVQFTVSVLRLLPNVVVTCLDSDIILSIQARKFFSVPSWIFLLAFYSMFLLTSTILLMICSILLFVISSIVSLLFSSIILLTFGSIVLLTNILLLPHIFQKGLYNIPDAHFFRKLSYDLTHYLLLSHFFVSGVILSLST